MKHKDKAIKAGGWDWRAKEGTFVSGYQDPHVEELEWQALVEAFRRYLPHFRSGSDTLSCLEVGCHVGYTTRRLYNLLSPVVYDAFDVSKVAILVAQKYKQEYQFSPVNLFVASATHIPVSTDSYNLACSIRCIQNIFFPEDQVKVFRELYRVLKPGGLLFLVENWQESLDALNCLRESAGMEKILNPKHTHFLSRKEIWGEIDKYFELIQEQNFASAYYFGTRFAKWLDADAEVNDLEDKYNIFYKNVNQVKFSINLGPSLLILQKK